MTGRKDSQGRVLVQQEPPQQSLAMLSLTWARVPRTDLAPTAMMACDNRHVASLSDHAIDAAGVVTPSVVCPDSACDFHEYVVLVDWEANS